MLKKVTILFFPQIINNFEFLSNDNVKFFDFSLVREKYWEKKENKKIDDFFNSFDFSNNNINEIINNEITNELDNVILINYPRSVSDLIILIKFFDEYYYNNQKKEGDNFVNDLGGENEKKIEEELNENDNKKIIDFNFLLLNIENYEIINEIQKEFLICPICEKMLEKKKSIIDDKFNCLIDENHSNLFSLQEMIEFNRIIFEQYLLNIQKVTTEFFNLVESEELKKTFLNINLKKIKKLTVNSKDEIISGKLNKEINDIIKFGYN